MRGNDTVKSLGGKITLKNVLGSCYASCFLALPPASFLPGNLTDSISLSTAIHSGYLLIPTHLLTRILEFHSRCFPRSLWLFKPTLPSTWLSPWRDPGLQAPPPTPHHTSHPLQPLSPVKCEHLPDWDAFFMLLFYSPQHLT